MTQGRSSPGCSTQGQNFSNVYLRLIRMLWGLESTLPGTPSRMGRSAVPMASTTALACPTSKPKQSVLCFVSLGLRNETASQRTRFPGRLAGFRLRHGSKRQQRHLEQTDRFQPVARCPRLPATGSVPCRDVPLGRRRKVVSHRPGPPSLGCTGPRLKPPPSQAVHSAPR